MKTYTILVILACFGLFFNPVSAQTPYATLKKNVNVQAKDLYHELNATKDTLLLESNKKINYVYSINKSVKRELSYTVNANEFQVPLNSLSRGRHVFVVVQSPLRIVFVVNVLKDGLALVTTEEENLVATKND
ncbi:hypothetical protein [Winogradskyella sp. 3972H.M.0a.05]|uniref:hypothetical protein n=1 Tax=Winogradskyella sp. 3972H.M.0a.05 TaxID=2950277 RepID=UPI00339775ED